MPAAVGRGLQRGLGLVPDRIVAHPLGRTVRELDLHIVEAEVLVDIEDQPRDRHRFGRDLVGRDEDVRVVLREGAHAHQAVQRARRLVAMHLAELREAQRQVAIAADALLEDLHVARAVHRLDGVQPLVRRARHEHVLAELLQVARLLPQRGVHDLRRVDFLEAGALLRLAHVADQALEDAPALGMPEHRAGRLFLHVEQVELAADLAMVALLGLFEPVQVVLQLLSRWPRPCRRCAGASRCANRRASRRRPPSSA